MKNHFGKHVLFISFFALVCSYMQAQSGPAAFSYPAPTFCQSDPVTTPTVSNAGVFSEPTGGLQINSSTGAITPGSSVPGIYQVTHIVSSPSADTATAIVRILEQDRALFTYTSDTLCGCDQSFVPQFQGTPGGLFTASPPGLNLDQFTGTFSSNGSPLTPGTFTICWQYCIFPVGI